MSSKTSKQHLLRDSMILLVVGLLGYASDYLMNRKNYSQCSTISTQISLALHHVFATFINFGWLSNNQQILYVLLIIIPLIMLHWITNNNQCLWSQQVRNSCGNKEEFNSILRQVGKFFGFDTKAKYSAMNYTLLFVVWIIVAWKLFIRK